MKREFKEGDIVVVIDELEKYIVVDVVDDGYFLNDGSWYSFDAAHRVLLKVGVWDWEGDVDDG